MLAAVVCSAALGFTAPKTHLPAKPKLLVLRGGGVPTDVLYNSQLVLTGLTGLQGWLAPVSTLKMYGKAGASDAESAFVRVVSGMNVVVAATMVAAKSGLDAAVTTCALAWALAICYNIPVFEKFDVPKPPLVGFIIAMGAVGAALAQGILPAEWGFNIVVSFFLIAVSVGEIFAQDKTLAAFNMPASCSPLVKSLMFNFDMTKLAVGAFLLVTKLTGKTGLGLVAMSATILLNVILTAPKSDEVGIEKGGLVFWGVVQSAIGTLAYLNEK